jgi:hypothetical protein
MLHNTKEKDNRIRGSAPEDDEDRIPRILKMRRKRRRILRKISRRKILRKSAENTYIIIQKRKSPLLLPLRALRSPSR